MGIFFDAPSFDLVRRVRFVDRFLVDRFPRVEEAPPLPEFQEQFAAAPITSTPIIRWTSGIPGPRFSGKTVDGKHTLQIQSNAIIAAWTPGLERDEDYVAYSRRREDFLSHWNSLREFFEKMEIPPPQPSTCFISYVNHIEPDGDQSFAEIAENTFTNWRNTGDSWLPPVESSLIQMSFLMPDRAGRLHAHIVRAQRRADQRDIVRFELTARSASPHAKIEKAFEWLDLGHEWIVRGFDSLTTPAAHRRWRKVQ